MTSALQDWCASSSMPGEGASGERGSNMPAWQPLATSSTQPRLKVRSRQQSADIAVDAQRHTDRHTTVPGHREPRCQPRPSRQSARLETGSRCRQGPGIRVYQARAGIAQRYSAHRVDCCVGSAPATESTAQRCPLRTCRIGHAPSRRRSGHWIARRTLTRVAVG
jgi:hypothetical protein